MKIMIIIVPKKYFSNKNKSDNIGNETKVDFFFFGFILILLICSVWYPPSGEIIDIADEHLELAAALRREAGVHLHRHRISYLPQLPYGGPTLLLHLLQYSNRPGPPPRALHPTPHHQRRRRTHRRRAHHRRRYRHFPHHLRAKIIRNKKKRSNSLFDLDFY